MPLSGNMTMPRLCSGRYKLLISIWMLTSQLTKEKAIKNPRFIIPGCG